MKAIDLRKNLIDLSDAKQAVEAQRFFKTGVGEYGEGDLFAGLRVPQIRKTTKDFYNLSLVEVEKLLSDPIHEVRFAGLAILSHDFAEKDEDEKASIFKIYLKHLDLGNINNWDLVDSSSEYIIGEYLRDKPRDILYQLVKKAGLWHRRVAMLATFCYIKRGDSADAIEIAQSLIDDKRDLTQKAVGWMLREVGKRCDEKTLRHFLDKNASRMPRTMLRYSIERLPKKDRQYYMTCS